MLLSGILIALGVCQFGLLLSIEAPMRRLLGSVRLWAATVLINSMIMTLYLWHMVAAIVAAMLFWAWGVVETAVPPSAEWWLWRPVWYLTCIPVLVFLIVVFGRS